MRAHRREHGVVLVVVLFFALLLTGSIATFVKRSTMDALIARHRDSAAQAEALARGGVRIAIALVLEDKLRKSSTGIPIHSSGDLWARASTTEIETDGGAVLRLRIEDTSSKLNLNALYDHREGAALGALYEKALPFLQALLAKAVDEIGLPPAEKELYDPEEMAENLADYLDGDDERQRGGLEDDYYQSQDPPYRPRNAPLLSVEELRLVEGFDAEIAEALEDYVTVYPYTGAGGINPNTAPPHVLALLYASDEVTQELAREETVREILDVREDDQFLCPEEINAPDCTPIREIVTNEIFPPPDYASNAFLIESSARAGEIQRVVEAVVDVSQPTEPLLLSWRMR